MSSLAQLFDTLVNTSTPFNPLDEVWHPLLYGLYANGVGGVACDIIYAFEIIGGAALVFLFFRYLFRLLLGKVR